MKNVFLALGSVAAVGAISQSRKKGSMSRTKGFIWNRKNIDASIERNLDKLLGKDADRKMRKMVQMRLKKAALAGPEVYEAELERMFVLDARKARGWHEAAIQGHEAMKRVKESAATILPKLMAEIERLQGMITDLREENKDLRARIKELEE